jgi:hypothetical protein
LKITIKMPLSFWLWIYLCAHHPLRLMKVTIKMQGWHSLQRKNYKSTIFVVSKNFSLWLIQGNSRWFNMDLIKASHTMQFQHFLVFSVNVLLMEVYYLCLDSLSLIQSSIVFSTQLYWVMLYLIRDVYTPRSNCPVTAIISVICIYSSVTLKLLITILL